VRSLLEVEWESAIAYIELDFVELGVLTIDVLQGDIER
jgi:hypothetical protein